MFMRFKMFIFLFLSSIMFSSALDAGEAAKEHGHKTPHGGIVQEAEGVHLEFLVDQTGEPRLYVYGKGMTPVARPDLEAKLTIKGRDSVEHSRLQASKDSQGMFVLKGEPITRLKDWDTAVVSFKLKDSWKDVRFSRHSDPKARH